MSESYRDGIKYEPVNGIKMMGKNHATIPWRGLIIHAVARGQSRESMRGVS